MPCECRWSSAKVIEALEDVMVIKGMPEHSRSDNGPEFEALDLQTWLANTGANAAYNELRWSWENGYCERFNCKLRDEFLNGRLFYAMKEIRVLAERWRIHYNTVKPHSSLGVSHACALYGNDRSAGTDGTRLLLLSLPAESFKEQNHQMAPLYPTIQLVEKIGQTNCVTA